VSQNEEFYVCIYSHRQGDTILFHHEGGVEIGDVDAKVNAYKSNVLIKCTSHILLVMNECFAFCHPVYLSSVGYLTTVCRNVDKTVWQLY